MTTITAFFAINENPLAIGGDCAVHCRECGASGHDADSVKHRRRCETPSKARVEAAAESGRCAVESFARKVRSTGLTGGRDDDVLLAVRLGYLSVSDAMNTDD